MYLYALEQGVEFAAVFADTGNEHEATYEYVRELPRITGGPEITWVKADFAEQIARKRKRIVQEWPDKIASRALSVLHPTGIPFLDLCLWKGRFPGSRTRFCTSELKVIPTVEMVIEPELQAGHDVYSWQGVRRDESRARSAALETEHQGGTLWHYRPLVDWSVEDVFAIHKRHGVRPNPLYLQGMTRVGCMPCIMARKAELHEIARRFPAHIEKIREWETLVHRAGKSGSTFFCCDKIPGTSTTRGAVDSVVSWAATTRGGQQFDMLKLLPPPVCSSEYGLCE